MFWSSMKSGGQPCHGINYLFACFTKYSLQLVCHQITACNLPELYLQFVFLPGAQIITNMR